MALPFVPSTFAPTAESRLCRISFERDNENPPIKESAVLSVMSVVDVPVLIVREGRPPPFSPLNARDERGCGELHEIQTERLLNLRPDPLDRVSVESDNRSHTRVNG